MKLAKTPNLIFEMLNPFGAILSYRLNKLVRCDKIMPVHQCLI